MLRDCIARHKELTRLLKLATEHRRSVARDIEANLAEQDEAVKSDPVRCIAIGNELYFLEERAHIVDDRIKDLRNQLRWPSLVYFALTQPRGAERVKEI